jgi:glutathionyl-hydroquinone reductase
MENMICLKYLFTHPASPKPNTKFIRIIYTKIAAMSVSKAHTAVDETSGDGKFRRTEAGFRNKIDLTGEYAAGLDRYHLYISYACPWANRCLAVLQLKGLEHVIGVSVVHPTWQKTRPSDVEDGHTGWVFRNEDDPPLSTATGYGSFSSAGVIPDNINKASSIRELYELSNDKTGKYSVPVLWDKKTSTIVNNESSEIIRMFNSEFNAFAKNPELDLYPEDLRKKIDEVNEWIYPNINNGVYCCGFAKLQSAYDKASKDLFENLDRVEEILSRQRYITGNRFTEADIRLFMTLVRFDEVYVVYFKTNYKKIEEYPNMMNYCRELYQMMQTAINMDHIKTHYFTSHPTLNTYGIIPRGPNVVQKLLQPHNRDRFPIGQ